MRAPGVELTVAAGLTGALLRWYALAFAAPALFALGAGEPPLPFVASGAIAFLAGGAFARLGSPRAPLRTREGFLVVALVWMLVPLFGALPFLFGDVAQLARPLDAYFEAVSGFTATGATVVGNVEELGRAMLFWRQLTHWLGGMGIIVLAIAVLPRLRIGGRDLLRSELPGPAELEPLRVTIRDTAQRLWKVYVAVTVAGILALAALGWTGLDPRMDLFEAYSHATSAVALGGFSSQPDSVSAFAPVTQWLLCALMIVAGVNFLLLHRLLVLRRVRAVARDEELRLYLALLVLATAAVAAELLTDGPQRDGSVRDAAFQAVSVMTTTGFATADWTTWGTLATLTLLALMFVGASAGSPSGSIKVVRHLMLFRLARRELEQAVHPEAVTPVRVSAAAVDDRALRSAVMFVVFYLLAFLLGAFALALDARLDVFEALGAAAACLGNVGPAFGEAGPFGSYAGFGDLSTAALIVLMLLGRLEIVPLSVLLTRSYWRA
jgi:trk system potassium uptake protein TrkH